jgi:hypothetical protein
MKNSIRQHFYHTNKMQKCMTGNKYSFHITINIVSKYRA